MKPGWKRYLPTRQTFPHVDPAPWSVLDKDRMETVEGTEGMTEEQARAKAQELEDARTQ